jgi:TPR repeat protein
MKDVDQHGKDFEDADQLFREGVQHHDRKEYGAAFESFLAAAKQGHIKAECCLGKMYADAEFYRLSGVVGLREDRAEAVRWYLRAAEAGYPLAQKLLGLCYCHGKGVAKDPMMGRKWLVLAAKQRDRDALFFLGNFSHLKWGAAKSDAKAYRWYHMAASRGHREARKVLQSWTKG